MTTLASSFVSVSAKPYQYRGDTVKPYKDSSNSNNYNNYRDTNNYNNNNYNNYDRNSRNYDNKYNSNNYNRNVNDDYRYENNQNRQRTERRDRRETFYGNIPAGTVIQTKYPEAKKILVTKEETAPFTLEVRKR